jgi:predicted metalloendopeptidase
MDYMDKTVAPADDFYHYADGTWLKKNPVPPDKSRWASFSELQERNWHLIHGILDATTNTALKKNSPAQKVRDFYLSALNTNRLENLRFKPLDKDLKRIEALRSKKDIFSLLADFHLRGVDCMFSDGVAADAKNSTVYAYHLGQGGLGLPDRDYYLKESFVKQREAYTNHIARMLVMVGEDSAEATAEAATILDLETQLAKACKPRADLRDPVANYHKFMVDDVEGKYANLGWKTFFGESGLEKMPDLVVSQPEFFDALDKLVAARELSDW